MKGCEGYYAIIQLYANDEKTGLEHLRAHLRTCEICRVKFEADERLSTLLRRSRPLYPAPDEFRKRILQSTNSVPPTAVDGPVDSLQCMPELLARPVYSTGRRVLRWALPAAATLIVLACLVVVPSLLRLSRAKRFIETAVAAHRSLLNGELPLEIQSNSTSAVTAWFGGKLHFTFRLPNSAEETGLKRVYQLTGGRLINFRGEHVALVAYRLQKEQITLLVSSEQSAVAVGGEEISSGGITFHYSKRASFTIITWSNHGLTYALVSSLPGPGRQSCLVCHQGMADHARF
jgi:anti-sigma factor RsiW